MTFDKIIPSDVWLTGFPSDCLPIRGVSRLKYKVLLGVGVHLGSEKKSL